VTIEEWQEDLNEHFSLLHIPEGFRVPECACGCQFDGVHYVWLLDWILDVRVPFVTREDAVRHMESLGV
jgi:hypothetical protein